MELDLRFPMMATIDITKLSAKVLDYTDAEAGALIKGSPHQYEHPRLQSYWSGLPTAYGPHQ